MRLVWITVVRGVMAIVLGLALALHGDRAPAALANFMAFTGSSTGWSPSRSAGCWMAYAGKSLS